MVLFFVSALMVSIIGMVALLSVKRYEMNTGRVLIQSARPALGSFFYRVLATIKALPLILRYFLRWSLWHSKVMLQRLIARVALWVEYFLEQVLHIVREKTAPPRAEGEASAFLREVADHKRELLKRSQKERSIVE